MDDFMERREFEENPEDLEQVAGWLRAQRPEVSALELDRIKQRARAQAMRGERRGAGAARPRRAFSTAITVAALTVGIGGAFAIAGQGPPSWPHSSGSSGGSAAFDQYCPPGPAGKKCRKEREKECLKQAERDKKDFEQQQKQEKKDFEQQQKQDKKDFLATNPTRQQKKAFEEQQKQDKKDFEQQQKQAKKDFEKQNKAQKKACKEHHHHHHDD
ncbi:MAG: hypothetical protein AABM66_11200 [Actinomycetota bacterium]